jgi:D-threo-aldose 1-dehydrogenase
MSRIFPATRSGISLGLGGAPLGNMYAAIGEDAAQALLRIAYADGCVTFDTAPHYGNGRSEQRYGAFLAGVPRQSVVVSTKVGRLLTLNANAPKDFGPYIDVLPNTQHFDYSGPGVRRCLEDSLARLGLQTIDVAYVHDCSVMTHGDRAPHVLRQVIDEAIPELERLRSQGLVRRIGVAVSHWQTCVAVLREADLDCLLLAGRYTLLDQSALSELLPLCEKRGVRVALGGAFNSGILATGVARAAQQPLRFNYEDAPPELIARAAVIETVCERHSVPLRAAALQFPLAHPAIDVVLAGVKSIAHWQDALTKMQHPIPPEFWQALRSERLIADAAPVPDAPVPDAAPALDAVAIGPVH